MYRYEMHCHTAENDHVVEYTADRIVRDYSGAGYDGIVITNHFGDFAFDWYRDKLEGKSHEEYIDHYLTGYRVAKKEGDSLGVNVLMGVELRFDGTPNDYLIYGLDEEFLYSHPLLNTYTLDSFLEILPGNALFYQAHPFRKGMEICDHKKLYGIETYNGNTLEKRNRIADIWADEFGLHRISGSDYHHPKHLAKGGCAFENPVSDIHSLVDELKNGRYKLIKDGQIEY